MAPQEAPQDLQLARNRFKEVSRLMPKKAKAKSVFHELYDPAKAAEAEIRSTLLIGLSQWLQRSKLIQSEAAKVLAVTQARVSDVKRGSISRFSLDLLARLAARAGLHPKLKLAA
jgi:predicted XRE-type DNA-binding protein